MSKKKEKKIEVRGYCACCGQQIKPKVKLKRDKEGNIIDVKILDLGTKS